MYPEKYKTVVFFQFFVYILERPHPDLVACAISAEFSETGNSGKPNFRLVRVLGA